MADVRRVAAIIARDGRVLAVRPKAAGEEGLWQFVGAELCEGEDAGEALARAVSESLGARLSTRWLLESVEASEDGADVVTDCYVCQLVPGSDASESDGLELRWLSLGDLLDVPWRAADLGCVWLVGTFWSQAFEAEHL